MTLNPNQFDIQPVQGTVDLSVPSTVITCQVAEGQATPLIAGQAVKIANTFGGTPKVLALSGNDEAPFGFVVRNLKDINYPETARVEVALNNTAVFMTAGAAIARGAKVEVVNSSTKVITNAGANPVAGFALDRAAADGDLIRVLVNTPFADTIPEPAVRTVREVATLAEINAGKEIIAGVSGKRIRVIDVIARVTDTFTTATSITLEGDTSGDDVFVAAIAAVTDGAILVPTSANTTLGAAFGADLADGEGLEVNNDGSAAAGGTNIAYTVTYALIDA